MPWKINLNPNLKEDVMKAAQDRISSAVAPAKAVFGGDLIPELEFKCKCGAECRLHCRAIAVGGFAAGLPVGVQHCSRGERVMPGGIPISLDVKQDGRWVEYQHY